MAFADALSGDVLTVAEWDTRSESLASALVTRLSPRTKVFVAFDTSEWLDFCVAALAVYKSDCILVPTVPDSETFRALRATGDHAVVTSTETSIPSRVARGDIGEDDRDNPVADALYTSGSTGRPKPVLVSHSEFIVPETAGDGPVAVLQCGHIGTNAGQETLRTPLRGRITVVYAGAARIDRVVDAIDCFGVSSLSVTPLWGRLLAESLSKPNLDVRTIVCHSEQADPVTISRIRAAFPNAALHNVLTFAEGGPGASLAGGFADDGTGYLVPGDGVAEPAVRIVDDSGDEVTSSGVVGLLELKPVLSSRQSTMVTRPDGWICVGDLARWNHDGTVHVVGRRANTFKVGSRHVNPVDIEHMLKADGRVGDAVVVPVADDILGHVPVALVEANTSAGDAELPGLADLVPVGLRPRAVYVVDALPRVQNDKVDRREASARAARYLASVRRPPPESVPAPAQAAATAWEDALGTRPEPDGDFFEAGGDSLAAVTLVSALEQALNVRLPAWLAFRYPRFDDLVASVEEVLRGGHLTL